MRNFIIISLFFIFTTISSYSEIVKSVKINGNKRVSAETINIYGEIKINSEYSEKDINKILNNLYSTNFFEDVKINLTNGVLNINLVEYPVINNLLILGEESLKYKDQIKKTIKSKLKDSFIKNNLSGDIDMIKKMYAAAGYNFTTVVTKINKIDESNISLIFEVDKGEKTKISKITFTGDKKIREKRLRDIIASQEDKFWKIISRNTNYSQQLINLDMRLLDNYYKSLGYYDANISSNSAEITKSGNVELIYSIDAGTRYIIKKITTDVDPVFNKDLFYPLNKKYKKLLGSYYSPFKIKKLLEEIDDLIENNNLQFVEHNVQEIIENDSIIIKFNIVEGEKVLVERINVLGNSITNENVIRSELLLDEGDPFTNLALDKSVSKIKSRNIFSSVKSSVSDGSSDNLKKIEISVVEQPTGEISAGAGVGTNGGSFAFDIKENNWLGEGKNIRFNVEVDQESLSGTIDVTDPNYDLLGNSLTYSIFSNTNSKPDQGYENNLVGTSIGTAFEQYKNLFASVDFSATFDDLKTDSTATASLKKQAGEFLEVAGEYGFSYDKRNRSFMPTDGSIVSFQQALPLYADKPSITNQFSASAYKTITENVIGAGKFYLTSVTGLNDEDVRISKRRYLSSQRLRGFEKGKVGPKDGGDHIGGNYSAALNFEANLPNLLPESTKTDIGMFLDFANVWGVDYDSSVDDSNTIRSSTGVAASWISPLGPMTFILSTNLQKASTDKTESFNFNLGTTF